MIRRMLQNKKVIVLGDALQRDVHNCVPAQDIYVLPNAITNDIRDTELQKILTTREKNTQLELLFLSNMEKTKGWFKVLAACNILHKRNVDFRCHFVGAWQSRDDEKLFRNYVVEHKLQKHVTYHGKQTGSGKHNILAKTDILLFPTEYPLETFGRVIIEGMMYGIPVIANNHGTVSQIVDDKKTGFVLQKNTPEEIATHIMTLQDAKLRKKMGLSGREKFLKEFEMKQYTQTFKKILQEV